MTPRVGVYDLYWSTMGGGEQVAGTIAQTLAESHEVTLLGPTPLDAERMFERLGVDVSACGFERIVSDEEATAASSGFDLFVNSTYLSRATNQSPVGWYYVHFPGVPPTARSRARHLAAVSGVRALSVRRGNPAVERLLAACDRRVDRREYVPSYSRFLANSHFTAGWTRRLLDVEAAVVAPPVRLGATMRDKRPIIANVGRFFDPRFGHSKKQLELIEAFERLGVGGWRLQLVGGCDAANRDYALSVRRRAQGQPIDVFLNATGDRVEDVLGAASVYWHGSGYGEDPNRNPERFEHFGITVVEAMARGAVPVVFGAAGPAEIVRDGLDGFHWHDLDELGTLTRRLVDEPRLREEMARSARTRAEDFSVARFAERFRDLARRDLG